jgi:hypothetical protein
VGNASEEIQRCGQRAARPKADAPGSAADDGQRATIQRGWRRADPNTGQTLGEGPAGAPEEVTPVPISADDFNREARGGRVAIPKALKQHRQVARAQTIAARRGRFK